MVGKYLVLLISSSSFCCLGRGWDGCTSIWEEVEKGHTQGMQSRHLDVAWVPKDFRQQRQHDNSKLLPSDLQVWEKLNSISIQLMMIGGGGNPLLLSAQPNLICCIIR